MRPAFAQLEKAGRKEEEPEESIVEAEGSDAIVEAPEEPQEEAAAF